MRKEQCEYWKKLTNNLLNSLVLNDMTNSKFLDDKSRPLVGPNCGRCGTKLRRKRVWLIGDVSRCKKCGWGTEYIEGRNPKWVTFILPKVNHIKHLKMQRYGK
jgi:hypothetical protein